MSVLPVLAELALAAHEVRVAEPEIELVAAAGEVEPLNGIRVEAHVEVHRVGGTDLELEVFIHGALCVAYSGQCYISHAHTGRSANRAMWWLRSRRAWGRRRWNTSRLLA